MGVTFGNLGFLLIDADDVVSLSSIGVAFGNLDSLLASKRG